MSRALQVLLVHPQKLVKFIARIRQQMTLMLRDIQGLAQGHSQEAQLSGCLGLALTPVLMSGSRASCLLFRFSVLCKPSPREEVVPFSPQSLQCCGALPAQSLLSSEGHQGRVALMLSLPTAVCGGTSWPADPAPHRPGWHGRLCCAHDHRTGAAGELHALVMKWQGWVESSHGLQIPKCLSQPQPGQQYPEAG